MKLFKMRSATSTHQLRLRNIYLLPTRTGLTLGITLILLLLTSINYQLNLGYALTFLIASAALTSVLFSYRALHRLNISAQRVPAAFVGDNLTFTLQLNNKDKRNRYGIGLAVHEYKYNYTKNSWVWCDVPSKSETSGTLSLLATRRGEFLLPEIYIQTHFPMGVFRAWSFWQPSATALVYPNLEKNPPPLPQYQADGIDANESPRPHVTHHQSTDYDNIRPYRVGDPMKQIFWKKMLPNGDLLTRETSSTTTTDLWLTLESTNLTHLEASLSRLTTWIIQAHKEGTPYGLKLGGNTILPALDEMHQLKCLRALALFQNEKVQQLEVKRGRSKNDFKK